MTKVIEPELLFSDKWIAVVNKPCNMPSQPDPSGDRSVLEWVTEVTGKKAYPLQRLDRPSAGLVVVALTSPAAAFISNELHYHRLGKAYLALAENFAVLEGQDEAVVGELRPDNSSFFVDLPEALRHRAEAAARPVRRLQHYLAVDRKANVSKVVSLDYPEAKIARLDYCVAALGRTRALVEVHLLTGRHHQIRAQFAALGCPLAGDVKYGASSRLREGGIGLFASRLSFRHPHTREIVEYAALPQGKAWEPFLKA